MKCLNALLLIGCLTSAVFAQNNAAAAQELIRQQQRLEDLKVELEQWRSKRDSIVAVRWKEKQQQVEALQTLDEQATDRQNTLDRELAEQNQVSEELRALRAETQGLQQQAQAQRDKFIKLADQGSRLEEILGLQKNAPQSADAISRLNTARDKIEAQSQVPAQAFKTLLQYGVDELARSEVISFKSHDGLGGLGSLLPTKGYELRLGEAYAARMDENFQHASLLLPQADRTGATMNWSEVRDTTILKTLAEAFRSLSKADSASVLVPVDILLSPKTAQASKMAPPPKGLDKFLKQIEDADLFAYMILFVGFAGFLLSAERLWVWAYNRQFNKKKLAQFFEYCNAGQLDKAEDLANAAFRGVWRRLALQVLQAKEAGHSREEVEQKVEEAFLREIPKLEQRVYTISVLSGVAPLMGLLGTVFGMIELFEAISGDSGDNAKRMAEGISIALVATELGLAVAIPVQLLHNLVSNRIDGVIAQIQTNTLKLINTIWHRS